MGQIKSGGTNSEGERDALQALVPERKEEENGEQTSHCSSNSGVCESVMSSPSEVRVGAPAENGFIVI